MDSRPPYPRTTDMAEMQQRCSPETWGFYKYWDSKRRRPDGTLRRMPSRSDIEPLEMKRWLPFLQLIDIFYDIDPAAPNAAPTRRLVYRLVGESDIKVRGYNPTGLTVEEAAIGKSNADPLGNYDLVITGRTPVFDWSKIPHAMDFDTGKYDGSSFQIGNTLVNQECILLPLSDDDDVVNMVITFGKVIPSTELPPR